MGEMEPLQVGIIVGNNKEYSGDYVMRTAAKDKFEVISLTNAGPNCCWTSPICPLPVRLLGENETLLVELSNGRT